MNEYIDISHSWSNGAELDTADTIAITGVGDLDVSIVTPGCTPRVLDEVVGLSVVSSVSNGEDTVVEGSSTARVEDTAGVHLEGGLVGLDGDGGWSSLDGGHEGRAGFLGDLGVSLVGGDTSVVGLVAGSSHGGVGVVGLELSTVVLVPVEGTGHGATVAASRAEVVAIDKLLLGEGVEGSVFAEVGSLKSAGGGEGPSLRS